MKIENMKYSKKKVLFIDLDGTLIKTASGEYVPQRLHGLHYPKRSLG